jgi:cytochrome c-type biogenesis protein
MIEVGFLTAFAAGLFSVSSPCVLPLMPLYLAHLVGLGEDGRLPGRRTSTAHALAFVVGFGLIFVLIGVSLGALGGVFIVYRPWLIRIGGLFMILLGLSLIGVIQIPFLHRERRLRIPGAGAHPGRLSSSFLVGVGFAAGWMPCATPVLGAILTMAVGAADPVRSGWLLTAYSLGMGIPFVGAALALGQFDRRLRHVGARLNLVSGVAVSAVGVLMVLGLYQQFFARIVGMTPWTPWEPSV